MKRWLLEQGRVKLKRVLTIGVLTALSAITSVSCSNNKEVLVTEIGVNPPSRRTTNNSQAGQFYVQGQRQHAQGDSQAAIAPMIKRLV